MERLADCPHCLRKEALAPTGETHRDTDGVLVASFLCADCGYSEAHPVSDDSPPTTEG